MPGNSEALVRALGEFAVHVRKRHGKSPSSEKSAILRWLRSLSVEELASLCCVQDAGFVKTLLQMGARSRGPCGVSRRVQEFQLLSVGARGSCSAQSRRQMHRTPSKTSLREFVKRPLVRTEDGDVVGSFYSREYEECSDAVLRGMRVLNTLQSCDTVALSMDFFETKEGKTAVEFFHVMEVISRGDFLSVCPTETTLKHRVWGETKWLTEQGYYSVQALFINQIELNIWASWKQYQKSAADYKVPLDGLASKLYLIREWELASNDQHDEVLKVLSTKMMTHLRSLRQSGQNGVSETAAFQAARSSLEALGRILVAYQHTDELKRCSSCRRLSVDIGFTCSFEDAFTFPQTAVMKLLLAEHLQERCSVLLSDRLSKEEEIAAAGALASVTTTNGSAILNGGLKSITKGSNHSQRRRASRKKMLKQRRRESEIRAAQQAQFSKVLRELCEQFRKKREQRLACADQVLHDIITAAVDEAKPIPGGWILTSDHDNVQPKQKRKKRKSKKKKSEFSVHADLEDDSKSPPSIPQTPVKAQVLSAKMRSRRQRGASEEDTGDHSAATAGSDSSSSHHEPPHLLDNGSTIGSTRDDSPRLSFFSNVSSSATANGSTPVAPALQLPPFGSHSLYSSSGSTPFFLSLGPRENHTSVSRSAHRDADDDDGDEDNGGNRLCAEPPGTSTNDATSISDPSNFEWYLPSVFSLQSSVHRTIPPAPTLDWHFNHWQFKTPDNGVSDKSPSPPVSASTGLDAPPPPSSSSSASSASSRFANSRGSTKKYSLASFSRMAGMDSSRRGSTHVPDRDRQGLTIASAQEDGDGVSGIVEYDTESDFLYREGGFFDRQRSLKRRRRPWPFNYAHEVDEEEVLDEHEAPKDERSNACESPRPCHATAKDDAWTECAHCCKCACHRVTKGQDMAEDFAVDIEQKRYGSSIEVSHQCEQGEEVAPVIKEQVEIDAIAKIIERVSQLEEKLAERTKKMDELAVNASSEVATLKQTVAALTAQLHGVENEIQELQLQQVTHGRLEDSTLGNVSSCSSPPAPFSPSPSSLDQQVESPPTAAPPLPSTYSTTNSVLGPFVSVPLSVLPPRSKLHWDLCEFAAQLQADSDACLPAQLAAQRLCTATVQSLWPRAQVRPYGSHVTRLVLPSSDVDLVICLPKVRRDAPADAAGVLEGRNAIKETWQQNLARKLRQEPWVVRDSVKTLPHAAVPIITLLTTPPYNVRLDISFEGPGHNGLATNDVVLALLHEFPPLAPMMLVLKSFAIERGLAVAYSGGLSSYALLLLVARYLQEHSDTMPNGFANASRAVQHSLSSVQAGVADFGLMLMGFLDFYGNRFDPRTTGISVASRCFLNRESTFLGTAPSGMGDPHQVPPYQQQYAADDAAVDDRTSQYGYAQHWQVPVQPHLQSFSPNVEIAGPRRPGYRSSLDLPASKALDDVGAAATGILDYQQLQQQTYDPHKFDPIFIEDPLCPSNNVGRNCFRIMQIRRAFSAAHLALLAASRDPAVFADNRMGLIAGVGLHPDNILRSILGAGAPVNAKSETATPAAVGVMGGMEHQYAFYPYNQQHQQQQLQQQYAYHHHHHNQPQQQQYYHVGIVQPRSVSTSRNESGTSRRHSESESEKLTTRSVASGTSQNDRMRKKRVGSPRFVAQNNNDENEPPLLVQQTRQRSTGYGRHPQRQSSLKQFHGHSQDTPLSRKSSERSMSLSLSFADVVRDGGNTSGENVGSRKPPQISPLRPPRFSRDDMALEESINERWETKDDSELK